MKQVRKAVVAIFLLLALIFILTIREKKPSVMAHPMQLPW